MASKAKILIVDNEPLSLGLCAATLSSEGYEIILAFDGSQAVNKVDKEHPDLIILDISIPDLYGFELTQILKNNFTSKDVPIILITNSDDPEQKSKGLEAGADDCFNAPIQPDELSSRVKSLLDTKKDFEKAKHHRHAKFGKVDNNPSVLLVIENENEAKLIESYLIGQPYNVMIEKTAKEAVELCKQHKIDLLLFDTKNAKDGSFEALGRLKEKEQTANIQILVISDFDYFEKNHQLFELWLDDFLLRPINETELELRVSALLKKKSKLDGLPDDSEDGIRSAITDRQSGLANYSYFKFFLEHELKRYGRDHRPVSLILLEINEGDNLPDSVGDSTIAKIINDLGTLIRENIREIDLGARYNERKFAIVLSNTDTNGATIVANRLKVLIQNYLSIDTEKSFLKWEFNHGIAGYPHDAISADQLIDQAEKLLFLSKIDSG